MNRINQHKILIWVLLIFISVIRITSGQIIINEVSSSNYNFLPDEDGDYSDWIELLNTGKETLNLLGYSLSDDAEDLQKWSFPEYRVGPGEFLLVFASGKDKAETPMFWNTVIKKGDNWKYLIPDSSTPVNWKENQFDDSSWESGPSGIGYGDGDDATTISSSLSVFMRKSFFIEDPALVKSCMLHMDFDDGFVAWLNGKEIARYNMTGDAPAYDSPASSYREALIYNGGAPEQFEIRDAGQLLFPGENILAIQVHNISSTSSDLSAIPFLSFLMPQMPADHPPEILDLASTTSFHMNFKIEKEGESLFLTDPLAIVNDSVALPHMVANHSVGRLFSDPEKWVVFEVPTPGGNNNAPYLESYVEELPVFSRDGGRFQEDFQLMLFSRFQGDTIYYTLDGSEPGRTSPVYDKPIPIQDNTIVRARIIREGYYPGKILSNTYFRGEDNQLPVLCLSSDPDNLWGEENGIYVKGPEANPDFPFYGANFWEDWERPVHIEFYENDGNHGFSEDAGMKIYGGWSRGNPQKSISFFARSKYGANQFNYRIFKDKSIEQFESFIIRNSGNDWYGEGNSEGTMIRDVLMTRLARDMGLEVLASRQAVVYINGEYWGIHNIREKVSEHFIASNAGVPADQIEMLEKNRWELHGDNQHYTALINFINSNDMRDPDNYEYVKSRMDIQNFINYQLAEIYYDNTDWPSNNLKYWRPAKPGGKWRWILYDTDFGFGLWSPANVNNNTLLFATEPNGPDYPNPPWSTFLLRKLLLNDEFKEAFVNSFADQINTSFKSERVWEMVEGLKDTIDEEMQNHVERWGGNYQNWVSQTEELNRFARYRPDIMRTHLKNTFDLGSTMNLVVDISDPGAGRIKLNSIFLPSFPWEGLYFEEIPVQLTAIPIPGYNFLGWSGDISSESPTITLDMSGNRQVVAIFSRDTVLEEIPVVINEISYKGGITEYSGDWIELYNHYDRPVDISGWYIKDAGESDPYLIKPGTILDPGHYHVICRDLRAFQTVFPEITDVQGEMDFGLSSDGDMVRLYNFNMDLIDSVTYSPYIPWPEIPEGSNFTLVLADPAKDNSLPASWFLSLNELGSPGGENIFVITGGNNNQSVLNDILFQNSPNPFTDYTRIIFYSSVNQWVRISIHDMNGRLIKVLNNKNLPQGTHEYDWYPDKAQKGIYLLRVDSERGSYTKKMLLISNH